MLGTPVDAWYVWVGVSLVAMAVLGVATVATPEAPARGDAVATTVETVDATDPPASGRHPIDADRVRVGPHRIDVGADGRDVAVVRGTPLTPAPRGSPLREVALGASPASAFDSPAALDDAARAVRTSRRTLDSAGDELVVRSVAWEEVHVTLVAA